MSAEQLHVAAFSPVQNCWHVESLAEHLRSNARNLASGTLADTAFCAVALTDSHESACDAIGEIEAALKRRKEGAHEGR
jgi:hypothetical protein